MISPEQCRAARGWLDWTQRDLATRAKVGLSTVRDFENRRRRPISNNLLSIHRVLEMNGIRFVDDPETGAAIGIVHDDRMTSGRPETPVEATGAVGPELGG